MLKRKRKIRINSEFKDYYDVVMGEGQDQTLVYQRHRKEDKENTQLFPFYHFPVITHNPQMRIKTHHIGFCGKVYTVLDIVPTQHANLRTKEARSHRCFCYSLEDVDKFVENNFEKDDIEIYFSKKYNYTWGYGERQSNFELYFKKLAEYEVSRNEKSQPFFENLCPVFVATYEPVWEKGTTGNRWWSRELYRGKIVYHASLREYEFFRIFPPYQAFQEINMWLSNQAVPIKPIPEISNEVMAEIKGFDKYSFRKDPSSKKRKK